MITLSHMSLHCSHTVIEIRGIEGREGDMVCVDSTVQYSTVQCSAVQCRVWELRY